MARPHDPTALADREARTFRARIREIKNDYGITSIDLSDNLEKIDPKGNWSERKVTNALAEGRTLLAETARQILSALKPTEQQESAGQGRPWKRYFEALALESNGWVQRMTPHVMGPAVFVPRGEAKWLADLLASRLVQEPTISVRQRDKIASVIERELKKAAPRMGNHWLAKMTETVGLGILEMATQGGAPARPSIVALQVQAGQVLRLAYEIEFSRPSEQQEKGTS